jgi:hypothetical protein
MSTDLITDLTVLGVGTLAIGANVHLGGQPGVDVWRVDVAEWRFATRQHVVVLSRGERTWSVADRIAIGESPALFTAIGLALAAA